ncbi:hypothetical protein EDM57_05135 [Brevibacillus gelatini]|uniref:Uncharacterized protein n=1 Tax=Brevibacillus gelatini TaxID=1655277 RepID=A0A3M8B971_9BACL|nr:hypothetical protein [Brevibacillus gelatini]RNB59527.1 hypothetical protein EDM57_05135 [Brevibacillus gelatini]
MSFKGFNFNNNRFNQEHHYDVEDQNIEINLRDAEDIVEEYLNLIKGAQSENELRVYLLDFYDDASVNEIKHYIHEDITRKMGDLYEIEIGRLAGDEGCDCGCCDIE